MNGIRALERLFTTIEKALLSALVATMVLLSFLQVVLRGAFSSGLLWADTLLRHLVLWLGFLGGALAASEDKQFAMDAAARILSGRLKTALHVVIHLFTAAVCGLLAKASWRFLSDEYKSGEILFSAGALRVPTWAFEVILPAGFTLLFIHYLLKTVEAYFSPAIDQKPPQAEMPA